METAERDLVLLHLAGSRERLLQAVDGLSEEQRQFRAAPDRWSVVDCIEHIILVERHVFNGMMRTLQAPAEPEKAAAVQGKEQVILDLVPSRARRVKGPAEVMPSGRWSEIDPLLRQFELTREYSIGFATHTEANLFDHCFPHPFLGDLNCYQWLLFLGAHCERHVRQLEEVKSDPAFPRSMASSA